MKMNRRRGLTFLDVAAVLAAIVVLVAAGIPVLAGAGSDAGLQRSMSNLITMGVAHMVYAADWNGRQVTWVRDDLGLYLTIDDFNQMNGCRNSPTDPNCHPSMIAGLNCDGVAWAYWSWQGNILIEPLIFPGSPNCKGSFCAGFGNWRIPNPRPFHLYLDGRYHDEIYYAPKDSTLLADVEDCIGLLCEFNPDCNPGWSSYAFSGAAMLHPDVMRSNADGGWQSPWSIPHGFESPGLFQATYPHLKTLMIEHSWLQNPPGECNPVFLGCEPYYFNQGVDSSPATLFYDGSVRLLPNNEVLFADFQVLSQTGGVDGLWHRGTSFGSDGYFIPDGFDNVPLSHHVLTTDGILGRDTLGGAVPSSATSIEWDAAPWRPQAVRPQRVVTPLTAGPDKSPAPATRRGFQR